MLAYCTNAHLSCGQCRQPLKFEAWTSHAIRGVARCKCESLGCPERGVIYEYVVPRVQLLPTGEKEC